MARYGVTFDEIASAANQLVGEGKNPTVEQVRRLLGTGSSSTIAYHLRQWKAQKPTQHDLSIDRLPHEFTSLMKGLWQRVLSHAETKVETIQKSNETFLAKFKMEMAELKRENIRLQRQCEQLQAERDALLKSVIAHKDQLVESRLKKIESSLKKRVKK